MNKKLPTFVRNDKYTGRLALARANKASFVYKFIPERMLSQINNQSSKEHYFHFLLGYLLPLVHAQSKYRFKRFLALDCGPLMSPILSETLTRLGYSFKLVSPSAIEKPVFLETWDVGWSKRKRNGFMKDAIGLIRQAWKNYTCPGNACPQAENLLIQRSSPHPFYLDGSSEVAGYGTNRRGIANLQQVSEFLRQNGVIHAIYEPGAHCLGCQIQAFGAARRILGFRGAEWSNLVWSDSCVRVRMLDASPPARLIGNFMTYLNIKHEFAIVNSNHSPENPQDALRFFSEE